MPLFGAGLADRHPGEDAAIGESRGDQEEPAGVVDGVSQCLGCCVALDMTEADQCERNRRDHLEPWVFLETLPQSSG